MTSNQIAFANYKETVRDNKYRNKELTASRKETTRHNKEQENIGYSNVALGYANLNELFRHNYAIEGIQQQTADINQQKADIEQQNANTREVEAGIKQQQTDQDAFSSPLISWLKPVVAAGYGVAHLNNYFDSNPVSYDKNSHHR